MKRLMTLAVALCLIAGCGGDSGSDGVHITFWQFWTSPDVKPAIEGLIKNYESANPGVTVDLVDLTWSDGHEKIVVAFSTGTAPDVVELGSDWVIEFAEKGVLADVSRHYDTLRDSLIMWEPATIGDSVYAFPWLLGTRALFTNLDLLKDAGIDAIPSIMTWDDLLHFSKAVSSLGEPYAGFGSNSAERHRLYKKFLPFLWSNGGRILSADGMACELSSDEAIAALEYYVKLSDAGHMDTQRGLEERFLAGELGFVISGDWMLRNIRSQRIDFEIASSVIPVPDTTATPVSFAGGEYLAVNQESEHIEETIRFARFMTSADANLVFARAVGSPTPANREAANRVSESAEPLAKAFLDQIATAQSPPSHPEWVYIEEILEKAVEKAIYHKLDARDALQEATDDINQILGH